MCVRQIFLVQVTKTGTIMFVPLTTLLAFLFLGQVRAQTGGTTSTGNGYSCVPAGFCNNNNNNSTPPVTGPGIDPRIVTPGNLCPAGTIVCFTQGPSSRCGTRLVPQTSTVDGPTNVGAYPWQAWLQNATNTFAGSGVLIDNYHVLTAAHKVANSRTTPGSIRVYMGVFAPSDITSGTNAPKNSTASSICVHPSYNPNTLINDIAIVRLASPISLSQTNINTACLPPAGTTSPYVGQRCVVSGWGQTSFVNNDAPTNPMRQVYVNIVNSTTCRTAMSNAAVLGTNVDLYLDPTGEVCAGGELDRDACSQDGGSPLVCTNAADGRNYIAGLVIWGKGCGRTGVYGVYVNVPYYRNWVDTTVASLNRGGTC